MSNSKLTTYVKFSPMCTKPRRHKIDTITIHHMAGILTVEQCGEVFQTRQASTQYGIDRFGHVGLYVDEVNRAWSTSNPENDHRAINIELANSTLAPEWKVSDAAIEKCIELCVDICQRNDIKRINFTGDKTGNLTMHKWFYNTNCPGVYLESKFPYIAREINKRLEGDDMTEAEVRKIIKEELANILAGYNSKPSGWAADKKLLDGTIEPGILTQAKEIGITDGTRPLGYAKREEVAAMVLKGVKLAKDANK